MAKITIAGIVIAFWAGWFINGWRINDKIATAKIEAVKTAAQKEKADTEKVNVQANLYADTSADLQAEIADLKRKLNAKKTNSASCNIDNSRLQYVRSAVHAANSAFRQ